MAKPIKSNSNSETRLETYEVCSFFKVIQEMEICIITEAVARNA